MALADYRSYARYVVELMRLPRLSNDEAGGAGRHVRRCCRSRPIWKASGKGLILVVGPHRQSRGASRAASRATAGRSTPRRRLRASPSSSSRSSAQRQRWGVELIPWRNLRELFGVLKRTRCWPAHRLGLPRRTTFRSGSSGSGRRCPRARRCSPPRPAPRSSRSSTGATADGTFHADATTTRSRSLDATPASSQRATQADRRRAGGRSRRRPSSGTASSRCGRRRARRRTALARRAAEMQAK